MSMPRLHFGLPSLKGGLAHYAKAFKLLEVRTDPAIPSLKFLARLKREAPEGFVFSLVAGKALAELGTGSPDAKLVEATRQAATTLGARWLLLRTPAAAGPSARTRTKLARLVELLRGAATDIAWEPRGMWTDEELSEVASQVGVTLVRDLAEHDAPAGPVVYTRLLALGRNSRIGSGVIERVTERLEDAEEAHIVIEGAGGPGIAKRLRQSLGLAVAEAAQFEADGDDEDDEDEDEDDSEGGEGDDSDEASDGTADEDDDDDDDDDDDEEEEEEEEK